MKTHWKAGDVVRLKVGGPDMCIARLFETNIVPGDRKKTAICEWFVGKKTQTGAYQVDTLEFVRQLNDDGETAFGAATLWA
jgi:uncharacterized protein YodC (DUF2158 family)